MIIETKFSNGDIVYGMQRIYCSTKWQVIGPITIGQVRVEITDSPGVAGEQIFSNYSAQKRREEQYMCIETGIGSGTLHSVDWLFDKKEDAEAEVEARNNKEQF